MHMCTYSNTYSTQNRIVLAAICFVFGLGRLDHGHALYGCVPGGPEPGVPPDGRRTVIGAGTPVR